MQNGPFTQAIAHHFGLDLSLARQISRALREADMLSTGARGVNAPHMTALDAARVTIAVLAGSIPTTAVENVQRWAAFRMSRFVMGDVAAGPFGAMAQEAGFTLLDALARLFTLYGTAEVLKAHEWNLAGRKMEPTLSITLSERPPGVKIVEGGASVFFEDLEVQNTLSAANERQAAALASSQAALAAGDPIAADLAEREVSQALADGAAAVQRLLSGKRGCRVTRTLTQEEIIPVALALASDCPTDGSAFKAPMPRYDLKVST